MPNLPWTSNSIAALTLVGVCDGQQVVNVHHFEASETAEGTLLTDQVAITWSEALANDWVTSLRTPWLLCHPTDYTLNLVKCQVIERPGNFRHKLVPVELTQAGPPQGGLVNASDALQTSVNIKWRTPQAGKSSRGRTYIGPVPSNLILSGRLNTQPNESGNYNAYAQAMIARYGALAGTQTGLYRLTIYSRPYNQGEYGYPQGRNPNRTIFYPPDYAGNSTNITVAVLDPVIRTQRRREIGVGS